MAETELDKLMERISLTLSHTLYNAGKKGADAMCPADGPMISFKDWTKQVIDQALSDAGYSIEKTDEIEKVRRALALCQARNDELSDKIKAASVTN